jgi:2-oxo-4-hydroxy-4-carboxy--5-ureidoimidazoline (OHCU) decarboxylase
VAPSASRLEELFEASSPLAQRLAAEEPFDSDEDMLARARELVAMLPEAEKIETLNAHPRIGERAVAMSVRSRGEQGADVQPELDALNDEYERKFGFRFVVFVNRRPKSEIVEVLRERLRNTREEELGAGLEAIVDIAADRARS